MQICESRFYVHLFPRQHNAYEVVSKGGEFFIRSGTILGCSVERSRYSSLLGCSELAFAQEESIIAARGRSYFYCHF